MINDYFLDWWQRKYSEFDALFLDIDGTLSVGENPLAGAPQLIKWLYEKSFPFRLLTNDGDHSPEEKSKLLARAGVQVQPDVIISCAHGLPQLYINGGNITDNHYLMGNLGKPCYGETAGLRIERQLSNIDECQKVIIGEGKYDWRIQFNAVFNAFMRDPEKCLIVPNPDSYWPSGISGEYGIGAGGKARFLTMLWKQVGINVEPCYLGKPYMPIFKAGLNSIRKSLQTSKINPERIFLLGDSLKSDIAGARGCGFVSGLVLTGITSLPQAEKASLKLLPDFIFNSITG